MEPIELLGWVAALLTTVAFVPQAWKTFHERDVRGISLRMYVVFTAGVATWLAYGIGTSDVPIIVANGITLALASVVLALRIKLGAQESDRP